MAHSQPDFSDSLPSAPPRPAFSIFHGGRLKTSSLFPLRIHDEAGLSLFSFSMPLVSAPEPSERFAVFSFSLTTSPEPKTSFPPIDPRPP